MQLQQTKNFINQLWDNSIIPALTDFIKIPNKSPAYDPDWEKHGYMMQAAKLIAAWCNNNAPNNMQLEILQAPGRTPLIFIDIAGQTHDTVLLYGHLDKQPEMEGWHADLGPWKPVVKDDKLYGRGGADDGYSAFAAIAAIKALQNQGIAHARCVIVIEACEESGSTDLPYYIEELKDRINQPSLIICLDSTACNYKQLWSTTSLRGMASGTLSVEILTEGVHSGVASGVVPSSFRIIRELLSRIENSKTGEILIPELHVEIPQQRIEQAQQVAKILGDSVYTDYPFVAGAKPMSDNLSELILNRTWRPTLTVTGVGSMPSLVNAGNVIVTKTELKLSFRLPPTCDAEIATVAIKKALETNPPYNAKVEFITEKAATGWNASAVADWLAKANDAASTAFFGNPCCYLGEGASIPFMGMLGKRFPDAQFIITGVLGPHSNAHGPNEFLHIPMAKGVTGCVAMILAAHCQYKNPK